MFQDDFPNGEGIFNYKNGASFTGTFVKGKPAGKGTFMDANGDSFSGNFSNGKLNGKGIALFKMAEGMKEISLTAQ